MSLTIRTATTEYLTATVTADHDITGRAIELAVPETGTVAVTWFATQVLSVVDVTPTGQPPGTRWLATYRVLLGPQGGILSLPPGTYDWTIRVIDTPERPVRKVSLLTVTAS